jgi:hypothetical protein
MQGDTTTLEVAESRSLHMKGTLTALPEYHPVPDEKG